MARRKKEPEKKPEDTKMIEHEIVSEIEQSYIDYSMSVIAGRALPDVRDGMKPVHRRILYGMSHLGVTPDKPHKKSARIVGEVMGKYHAHGDASIYDAMVRMSQDFSMRYPLVDGHGNFGSIDGDGAAASRYCVTGDTLISTNKGLVPIKSIVDSVENSDNPINIAVKSIGHKNNRAITLFNSGTHDVYEVVLGNKQSIKGTANHPLLTIDDCFQLKWKRIDELKPADKCVVDLDLNNTLFGENDDIAEAKMLGCMISEGYISTQNRIGINNKDINMINPVKQYLEKHCPTTAEICENKERKYYEYCIANAEYYKEFIDRFEFGTSYTQHIPPVVFEGTKTYVTTFLRYLFEGDGCAYSVFGPYHANDMAEIRYTSKSEQLVRDIQNILSMQFGILSNLSYSKKRDIWTLGIDKMSLHRFASEIGFVSKRKTEALNKTLEIAEKMTIVPNNCVRHIEELNGFAKRIDTRIRKNVSTKEKFKILKGYISDEQFNYVMDMVSSYAFVPVTSISPVGKEIVYSVKVDNSCHSFTANGFINHNTEARMSPFSLQMVRDIEKNTVDFVPNYDGEEIEPVVLPSRIPNLLVNGSNGIAVGMATNIPPHNLGECINACCKMIDDPDCTLSDLMRSIKGPDFPTGGLIIGNDGIKEMYKTGTGKFKVRAKAEINGVSRGRHQIIVTEIPYQVNKAKLVEKIAELVKAKEIEGITDIRDESSREGMRIVIEIKKDADPQIVLNNLYAKTQMQVTFGAIMLMLVDGVPRTLGLKDILSEYLTFQGEVIRRRTEYDLEKAEARAHILEGLLIALDNIDEVIKVIRNSTDNAKQRLMKKFKLTEIQAQAILDMRLARLQKLERTKIQTEYKDILEKIAYYKDILSDHAKIMNVVKEELKEIKKEWADKRRTVIEKAELEEFVEEDLIDIKESTILVTKENNIKKTFSGDIDSVIAKTEEADSPVTAVIPAVSTDMLLFFTDAGKVYQYKVFDIPDSKSPKGKPIKELIPSMTIRENIIAVINAKSFSKDEYAMFVMKSGTVKKISYDQLQSARSTGMNAEPVKDDDEIVSVLDVGKKCDLFLVTKFGKCIRFSSEDANPMGRTAVGVRGMMLEEGDSVMFGGALHKEESAIIVSENGHMKKLLEGDIKKQARGGKGVLMNPRVKLKNTGNMRFGIIAEHGDILEVRTDSNSFIIKTDRAKNLQMIDKMNNMRGISEENPVTECRKVFGYKEEE